MDTPYGFQWMEAATKRQTRVRQGLLPESALGTALRETGKQLGEKPAIVA
jgi:hypothetical protein